MSLISRWDIRTESYANGASVTSLTDRAGTTPLNSSLGTTFPTYSSAENAMSFDGSVSTIGSASLAAGLSAVPTGSAWSIFALVKVATHTDNHIGGFGTSANGNQGIQLRDSSSSYGRMFIRDSAGAAVDTVSTATYATGSWIVVHACLGSGNIKVGHSGANVTTASQTTAIASNTWDQFGLGAFWRSSLTNNWAGFIREVRVYNSDESANLSSIVSAMQAGPAVAATISSATPSGTLGTTTTATIGCTTNQNTGTLYYVASTNQAKITGATAAQVKAGNGSDGVALARNGSNTVSSTSPTIAATGFTAGTLYYYAVVQNNANGDSNVLTTGSFTTAVAYRSFSITLRDAAGALLNGVNLKFWTRTTKDGAAVDGGSTGLSITCGSNGIFSNSALTIAAGTYYLFWEDPSDPYKSHWMQYTFA